MLCCFLIRQAELEKQRTELENLDIIGLVRGVGLSLEQLAALIRSTRGTSAASGGQPMELEPESAPEPDTPEPKEQEDEAWEGDGAEDGGE